MITAVLVKELRSITGSGVMDCKNALIKTGGDIERAINELRKRGLSAAAKKTNRLTIEGLIALFVHGKSAAIIELNSETDFVSKNDSFKDLARNILQSAIHHSGDLESFKKSKSSNKKDSIEELIVQNISLIGENINLRRLSRLDIDNGIIASYTHNKVCDDMGRIGVLVAIDSDYEDINSLYDIGKSIAMHIAASNPKSISIEDLDEKIIKKEKDFLVEQASMSGKTKDVVEKMIHGRIQKFYKEVVLLEQVFLLNENDEKLSIKQYIERFAKNNNTNIKLKGFIKYKLGE